MSLTPPPSPQPTPWQQAFHEGRLADAVAATRRAAPDDLGAAQCRAMAAFQLGEMTECADAAVRVAPETASNPAVQADQASMLSASVVASCETLRFDQALAHLQQMLASARRSGDLASYMKARGTAANCFALMGDPWAAQRLLAELAGFFMPGANELAIETTVRGNLCATYLIIARWAKLGQDSESMEEAMTHAETNAQRSVELAASARSPRSKAFADVHLADIAILRGQPRQALGLLSAAIHSAEQAGFWGHVRALRVMQAEAALDAGELHAAHQALKAVAANLNEGHEISSRIRYYRLMQAWHTTQGQLAEAARQGQAALALEERRTYAQFLAQSKYLRTRLELEHLYRYRSSRSASTSTQPGALS
jgi:tetratricopeptide (TPR) repeat protein